jgi:hypothetical protein
MVNAPNNIDPTKQASAILASDATQDKLESSSQKRIAESLIKESENYSLDSNKKKEQAQSYLQAADALEKMAEAVRKKAEQLRSGGVDKENAVREVDLIVGTTLQMPVPKDATPEELEDIADALEEKARENRMKADDFLKESEDSDKMSKQLKEQANMIAQNDGNISDLRLKTAASQNEGLKMIYDKLGIRNLDNEYKSQVAYAEKRAQEEAQKGV